MLIIISQVLFHSKTSLCTIGKSYKLNTQKTVRQSQWSPILRAGPDGIIMALMLRVIREVHHHTVWQTILIPASALQRVTTNQPVTTSLTIPIKALNHSKIRSALQKYIKTLMFLMLNSRQLLLRLLKPLAKDQLTTKIPEE